MPRCVIVRDFLIVFVLFNRKPPWLDWHMSFVSTTRWFINQTCSYTFILRRFFFILLFFFILFSLYHSSSLSLSLVLSFICGFLLLSRGFHLENQILCESVNHQMKTEHTARGTPIINFHNRSPTGDLFVSRPHAHTSTHEF